MPVSKKKKVKSKKVEGKNKEKQIKSFFHTIIKAFNEGMKKDKFKTAEDIDNWIGAKTTRLMKSQSKSVKEITEAHNRAVSYIASQMNKARDAQVKKKTKENKSD